MVVHAANFDAGIALTSAEVPSLSRILVVDDSRVQRKILFASLRRWGFEVLEASSGEEALEICKTTHVDVILSDWVMPGMNGLEFCQAFRKLEQETYGYFILLTSKSEKNEIASGLDCGADDFLTKPVSSDELRARITAGERILQMERALVEKNRLVRETLSEMQALYDTIDRDLIEARKLQQSLVKKRFFEFGAAQVSLLLEPSGHVGGDLVGCFRVNDHSIGVYGIDVSGHGITSALMTARLAGLFSGETPEQNVALEACADGHYRAKSPAVVAQILNQMVLDEMDTEYYFTMVLGFLDLRTGEFNMVQAGHPHPILQPKEGAPYEIGEGGLPIGLFDSATYTDVAVTLGRGDRLFIASDGVTECMDKNDVLYDVDNTIKFLTEHCNIDAMSVLERLMDALSTFSSTTEFADDVSAALLQY
ncbi:MAG: PP2C family protein-serine/threonine phosphatase [Halocynthiibacter sp.]